ncbi:MAG: DUF393 domain-containing protein [Actinobacteria bacterium]|nr:DUF393 domain-containing protein [Actinomycetota bacterium]
MANQQLGTVVFDGDCGFCTWSIDQMKRWVKPPAAVVPFQFADLQRLGLTLAECEAAVQWVPVRGPARSGGRAVAAILKTSGFPWSGLGTLADLPGVRVLVDLLYRQVAAHRYQLPGATPACRLPQ